MKAIVVSKRIGSPLRCPYCHDRVRRLSTTCRGCEAPHHMSCFAEHGGCASCGQRIQIHSEDADEPPDFINALQGWDLDSIDGMSGRTAEDILVFPGNFESTEPGRILLRSVLRDLRSHLATATFHKWWTWLNPLIFIPFFWPWLWADYRRDRARAQELAQRALNTISRYGLSPSIKDRLFIGRGLTYAQG